MTNVSPVAVARATCPFCLFGCDLGIVSQFGQVTGVEYIAESPVNHGRLCARGNGAAAVINHPRRLTEPRSEGKRIDWERAWTELVDCFKNGNTGEIAFTLDRNLTNEEVGTILGFARALRVKTVGCSYLEPEGYFQYRIEGAEPAQLADIEAADLFIFVGDVFSQMPVIAKPVLDGRYRDRQHRLVTVDCIRTRTGFFADQAIITWPGTEPLFLVGVLHALGGKTGEEKLGDFGAVSGVEIPVIKGLATQISRARRIVIAAAPVAGHVDLPYLFSLAPQLVAAREPSRIRFLGIGEARRPVRATGFGEILSLIKARKIKTLVNFGESFPFNYPQLEPILKKLDRFVATATFIPPKSCPAFVLPVPTNLEKSGSIPTLWGTATLGRSVGPPSGARSIEEILETVGSRLGIRFRPEPAPEPAAIVDEKDVLGVAAENLLERQNPKRRRSYPLRLLGEKPAIEFHGLFDDGVNRLKLNPADLRSLNLNAGETVLLTTPQATEEFLVERSNAVPPEVAACSVNRIENRRLFEVAIDKTTGDCIIPSTSGRVWKKI